MQHYAMIFLCYNAQLNLCHIMVWGWIPFGSNLYKKNILILSSHRNKVTFPLLTVNFTHTFTNCRSERARTLKSGTYWGVEALLSCELLPLADSASTLSVQLSEAERFSPLRCEGERNSETARESWVSWEKTKQKALPTHLKLPHWHTQMWVTAEVVKNILKHNVGQVVLTVCLNKLNKKTPTSTKWESNDWMLAWQDWDKSVTRLWGSAQLISLSDG